MRKSGYVLSAVVLLLGCSICTGQISEEKDKSAYQRKLNETISVPADIQNVTLVQFLNHLSKRHNVAFEIDLNAFEKKGIQEIEKRIVRLAARKRIKLADALNTALKPLNATCVAGDDCISIIPLSTCAPEKK